MRSAASARLNSQYGFCSRVTFAVAPSTWTWTRASTTAPFWAWRRISVIVSSCIPCSGGLGAPIPAGTLDHVSFELLGRLDHAARNPRAGVAGGIRFQVVVLFVNHER